MWLVAVSVTISIRSKEGFRLCVCGRGFLACHCQAWDIIFSLVSPMIYPEDPSPTTERRKPCQNVLLLFIAVAFVDLVAFVEFLAFFAIF